MSRSAPIERPRLLAVVGIVTASVISLSACGSSETPDVSADGDRASQTAAQALETAEEALSKVKRLEAELRSGPDDLAMVDGEGGVDGEAGHEPADEDGAEPADEEGGEEDAHEEGHWTYDGETGPDRWAEVSADFALCETGVAQSPIDIAPAAGFDVGLDDLQLAWQPSDLTIVDNGHTIQANVSPGNQTTFDGVVYDLVQFHFHKPSEHTVDSETFPMELHFVHATAAGDLAVIGVLLAEGEASPAFDGLFAAGTEVGGFDLTTLLPPDLSRYRYAGSLTTPPCSEGVNWNVLSQPVSLSGSQIAQFVHDGNARPVQELSGRQVLVDQTGS